jgi:phosphonate transport system ATP-binding protein
MDSEAGEITMLQLKEIHKTYRGSSYAALNGINLTIDRGEFIAVLGRSGAGKSTLIRCINRLVEPDSGQMIWNGRDITGMNEAALRRTRGEIGMIFQHFNLLPRLSVLTNVISGRFADMKPWRSLSGIFMAKDKEEAMEALRQVEMENKAYHRVDELSGGQQQRVAIARVLMQNPSILLGDEPVSSLDRVTAGRIMDLIAKLHKERGMTVVMNLHNVELARAYATRIIGMASGSVVFDGPPELLDHEGLERIYPEDHGAPDFSTKYDKHPDTSLFIDG